MQAQMRSVVKGSLAAVVLLALSVPALAQDGQKPGEAKRPRTDRATQNDGGPRRGAVLEQFQQAIKKLDLTADQQTKIDAIFADAKTKFEDLRGKAEGDKPEARGEKVRELMRDTREKIDQVLTAEQREKLKEEVGRGMAEGGQMRGPMVQRLQEAIKDLNLNDDQKAEVKEIMNSYRPKFEAIREKHQGDMRGAMEESRPLLQELRDKVSAVLTPEQQQQLREKLASERGEPRDGKAGKGEGKGKHPGKGDKPEKPH